MGGGVTTEYRPPHERELETIDLNVNVGPQHPATHGVFRMVLTVDGEQVVDVDPVIGYMHRGAEKLSENCDYRQAIGYQDRTEYLGQFNAELCYVLAVEEIAGERMMYAYFRPGGVAWDVPEDFRERCRTVLDAVRRGIDDIDGLMTENEVIIARCRGLSPVTPEQAIDWGLTGPMLRATGLAHDLRRAEPYCIYDRFEFDIPTGAQGDIYDRYLVRLGEMRQSVRIVEQALKQMPEGPIMAEGLKRTLLQ